MRRLVCALGLVAISALPAAARPACRYDRNGDWIGQGRAPAACEPYRPVGERDAVPREAPRPRPWALPRGRGSLPMPGPF